MLTFQERRTRELPSDLRITTVDNYQGEENRIILLSLVRSNAEARIGFLKTENRVCVALSRARDGLFIIGNMENLTRSSSIWPQIKGRLEQTQSIGKCVQLTFVLSFNKKEELCLNLKNVSLVKHLLFYLMEWIVGIWSLHFRNRDLGVEVFGFPYCDEYLYTNLKINLNRILNWISLILYGRVI